MAIGQAPLTDRDFPEWLAADDQRCWILGGPERALGYGEILLGADSRDVAVAHLVVSPEHRNRGVGRLLTQLLFARGKPFEFPSVFMRIYPDNPPALKCYVAGVFTPVLELPPDRGSEWVWLSKSYDGRE